MSRCTFDSNPTIHSILLTPPSRSEYRRGVACGVVVRVGLHEVRYRLKGPAEGPFSLKPWGGIARRAERQPLVAFVEHGRIEEAARYVYALARSHRCQCHAQQHNQSGRLHAAFSYVPGAATGAADRGAPFPTRGADAK